MSSLSTPTRASAGFVAFLSVAATLILVGVREPIAGSDGSYLATAWALLRYFTILTNFIVAFVLARSAISGRWRSYSLLTGAAVWIFWVGFIYHLMLAKDHNPVGLSGLTNHIHHTIVPIGTVLIWALTKQRESLPVSAPFKWLIFPLGYTAYMIARAQLDGLYPYPFSDPTIIGWPQFFITQLVLCAVFLGLGFIFRAISNRRLG